MKNYFLELAKELKDKSAEEIALQLEKIDGGDNPITRNFKQPSKKLKPSSLVSELIKPDIYELYQELSDGTFLIRVNEYCIGTLTKLLDAALVYLGDSMLIGECAYLLAQISDQTPLLKGDGKFYHQGVEITEEEWTKIKSHSDTPR